MTKQVIIPIKQAGGTAAELLVANPIGYERQVIFETDTLRVKLLDGVTSYNDLPYLFSSSGTAWGSITGTLSAQTDLQNALNAKQATLVNQSNIKSINGTSLLGAGDLTVSGSVSIGDSIGSATAGSVLFAGALGVLAQKNANFFWDDTNNILRLGTPLSALPSNTSLWLSGLKLIRFGSNDTDPAYGSYLAPHYASSGPTLTLGIRSSSTDRGGITIYGVGATVNVGIGTALPVSRLHIGVAPTATANCGLVSLGSGAFDGSTSGFFTGSASGTILAINAASGFAGDLMNLQVAGVSMFKVSNTGKTTLGSSLKLAQYTVATLPASPAVGDKCVVTDASGAAVVGSIVVGGGAGVVEVVWAYGGAGWKITSRY